MFSLITIKLHFSGLYSMEAQSQLDQEKNVSKADRVDPYVKRTRFQCATSFLNISDTPCDELNELPLIRNAPEGERLKLLIAKMRQCHKLFDFTNPLEDLKSREIKRLALAEIIDFINYHDGPFEDSIYKELTEMVSINIFREFHQAEHQEFDCEEDEPLLEIAWPHIQMIYEILLRFLDSAQFSSSVAKKYIKRGFIYNLLTLFNSEDPRERDYLKTIIHRIYGKFLVYRAYIRKEINNIFLSYTFEGVYFNGISELLEILASIINGFSVPLKTEHRVFLERVLLPLYSCRNLSTYHTQLGYCVIQFINKEPDLAVVVLKRILKYWPKTSSTKEIVYLTELLDILGILDHDKIKDVVVPLFRQVCLCVNSSHFQVAETAIRFLKQEESQRIIESYANEVHPVILPLLYRVSTDHWHGTIKALVGMITRQIASKSATSVLSDIRITTEEDDKIAREREERHEDIFNRLEQLTLSDNLPDAITCNPPM